MSEIEKDKDREYRIDMEVVVDAYDSEERAMGWYYYVSDECDFPFNARCITERRTSPLSVNDKVEVLGTSPAEECEREIFVDIRWNDRKLAVPLYSVQRINNAERMKRQRIFVGRGWEDCEASGRGLLCDPEL